ncbi:MAG: helix-turn-helix domain-containing protein [Xanthomonadales bacterium]|nr:helix-turn-helix domain-containing protein [Xanthomonadales bacterium]
MVGIEVRRLRRAADLTQGALAERSGLELGTISRLERGERKQPEVETISAIDDALSAGGKLVFIASGMTPDVSGPVHTPRAGATEAPPVEEGPGVKDDPFGTIRYRWSKLSSADQDFALDQIDEVIKSFSQGDAIGPHAARRKHRK